MVPIWKKNKNELTDQIMRTSMLRSTTVLISLLPYSYQRRRYGVIRLFSLFHKMPFDYYTKEYEKGLSYTPMVC